MICPNCNTDNVRGVSTCSTCATRLPGSRHTCGFMNTITDQFCGGCGQHIIIQKVIFRPVQSDTPGQHTSNFTDNQLVTLLELQKLVLEEKKQFSARKQEDFDKLFE